MSQDSPPPRPRPGMLVWSVVELLALASVGLLALAAGPLVGATFLADFSEDGLRRGGLLGAFLVHAAVLAYVVVLESAKLRGWFRPRLRDALWGAVGGAGLLAAGNAYGAILRALGVEVPDVAAELRGEAPLGALLLWGAVIVPVAEEAYFRGRLPDAVRARLGTRWAVGVSSALFALAHGLPPLIPVYVLFAFVLWSLRERTGALVAPVIAHALNNAVGILPWGG